MEVKAHAEHAGQLGLGRPGGVGRPGILGRKAPGCAPGAIDKYEAQGTMQTRCIRELAISTEEIIQGKGD